MCAAVVLNLYILCCQQIDKGKKNNKKLHFFPLKLLCEFLWLGYVWTHINFNILTPDELEIPFITLIWVVSARIKSFSRRRRYYEGANDLSLTLSTFINMHNLMALLSRTAPAACIHTCTVLLLQHSLASEPLGLFDECELIKELFSLIYGSSEGIKQHFQKEKNGNLWCLLCVSCNRLLNPKNLSGSSPKGFERYIILYTMQE